MAAALDRLRPGVTQQVAQLLQGDRARYRQRNQVERLMHRRKQFRAVATRYDKLAERYGPRS